MFRRFLVGLVLLDVGCGRDTRDTAEPVSLDTGEQVPPDTGEEHWLPAVVLLHEHEDTLTSGEGPLLGWLGVVDASVDVDRDGHSDLLIGASRDFYTEEVPGEAWLVLGGTDLPGTVEEAAVLHLQDSVVERSLGMGGQLVEDLDGHGRAGLALLNDNPDEVYLFDASLRGGHGLEDAEAHISGLYVGSFYYQSNLVVVDLDGGGGAELMTRTSDQEMVLFTGPVEGELEPSDATAHLTVDGDYADIDDVVSVGDLDGDGLPDLALDCSDWQDGTSSYTTAIWTEAPTGHRSALEDADLRLEGSSEAVGVGDADGDGLADLLLSSESREVVLLTGLDRGEISAEDAHAVITGDATIEPAAISPSTADLSGDGLTDLVIYVVIEGSTSEASGASFVLLSPVQGAVDPREAELQICDGFYHSTGDYHADGWPDLIMGYPGWVGVIHVLSL